MKYSSYLPSIIRWNHVYPSHWDCEKAKRFFANPKCLNKNNVETNILSLTLGGVIRNNRTRPIGLSPSDYATYQIFEPNELVFKLIDLENVSTSRVGLVPERGIMSSAYIRLSPRLDLNMRYFYYQYFDWYKRLIFNGLGEGVRQTLSGKDLINLEILLPPREEQDQIVRYLDWQVSKTNKLISALKKQIALLKQQKQAVINEAVTKGLDPNVPMKDSGVEWIGEVPTSWRISRIGNHFAIRKRIAGSEGYNVLSVTQQGLKIKDISTNEGQMAANYSGYQFVYPGEFAMNHMDLLTGYIDISKYNGVTSPDYRVFGLEDTDNCFAEYYLYLFQLCYKRRIFYGFGRGAANQGRWRLPAVNFRNFVIPLPKLDEQAQIVAYLNEQCAKIDALIENINNEIVILVEYRTRLISDVVTGQIDVRDIEVPEFEYIADEADDASDDENTDDEETVEEEE